ERHDPAALGDDERVDLEQRAVLRDEAAVERVEELDEVPERLLAAEAEREGEPARLEAGEAEHGVDVEGDDLVGRVVGDLLDVHAALGRGHDRDAAAVAVEE